MALTDTTLRDAHQSLLATRMRTFDMLAAAPAIARLMRGLLSLECWGGATFDVALRFLHEDPWSRLERLREAVPNVCLQMLLRGSNLLAYSRFEPVVVRAFVAEAVASGIDVIRIFDALNDIEGMRPAIEAALETPALIEGALCYTGDLSNPAETLYTLDYYLRTADQLVGAGVHVLAIKDMAGLLRAPAARTLVSALRERFDVPVHLHTHDTAGGSLATYLAAVEAGVDALDGAAAPFAGVTSQPSMSAIIAALAATEREAGVTLESALALEPYWEAVRALYAPYESGLPAPTGRVYHHEIPGRAALQPAPAGRGDRRRRALRGGRGGLRASQRAARRHHQGHPHQQGRRRPRDLRRLRRHRPRRARAGPGRLRPARLGARLPARRARPSTRGLPATVHRARAGAAGSSRRPPPPLEPDTLAALAEDGRRRQLALAQVLFPGPLKDYLNARELFGDVSLLPTAAFFYGLEENDALPVDLAPGVRVIFELEAVGEPDHSGMRTVMARVNGQLRPLDVRDRSIESSIAEIERADPSNPGHVAAPVIGAVIPQVAVGDEVTAGEPVAVIEAMKMESTITAPISGRVERVAVTSGTRVERGDLLVVLAPAAAQ